MNPKLEPEIHLPSVIPKTMVTTLREFSFVKGNPSKWLLLYTVLPVEKVTYLYCNHFLGITKHFKGEKQYTFIFLHDTKS